MKLGKKLKKGKVLVTVIIGIILIVAVVTLVSIIKKHSQDNNENIDNVQEAPAVELPNTTYSDMQVTNINMEYLSDNDETMVSMIINNTTENTVSQESLTAILLNSEGSTVGEMPTYIESLAPGEQYSISVVLKGDLTSTASIKLQKEAEQPESQQQDNQ